ncbi:MAG: UTP--glucose-1-phosphate uridylyltransferase [Verrucomicrobia bacterium]|nr:UTP--glucose-1-phosphate uridylyltransferase [Kiritimatiellia bacterium]MCO6400443.1 UTP--glucose-1-phosphate uridylyltransferase [Verrucomicrobiota bacterium]
MSNPMEAALRKMEQDGASPAAREAFRHAFLRVKAGETGFIPEDSLIPVRTLPTAAEAAIHRATGERALAQTVILKLNGGLGTSMGLDKAKSLLPVKNGLTFLDLIARQVLHARKTLGIPLPLLLMNSFSTEVDTLAALAAYPELAQQAAPLSFLQNRIPKLRADTLEPISWPADPAKEWCPPGHGDLYAALAGSGTLARLLDAGIRYAFISNADNLGAGLDVDILGFLVASGAPFLMEATERTGADRKGGHLASRRDGGLLLRESAQCPEHELEQFQDITHHRYFNTNNLWLDLAALHAFMQKTGAPPDLPVMINRKTVDPRDPNSPPVLQLETAMGSALAILPGAQVIEIPRTRFSPVKTTDDLLTLWSDAYTLGNDARLLLDPRRNGKPPTVKLDPRHYKLWPDFSARFANGAPSLLHCESLTVHGDITFGEDVKVIGHVTVQPAGPDPALAEHRALTPTTRTL